MRRGRQLRKQKSRNKGRNNGYDCTLSHCQYVFVIVCRAAASLFGDGCACHFVCVYIQSVAVLHRHTLLQGLDAVHTGQSVRRLHGGVQRGRRVRNGAVCRGGDCHHTANADHSGGFRCGSGHRFVCSCPQEIRIARQRRLRRRVQHFAVHKQKTILRVLRFAVLELYLSKDHLYNFTSKIGDILYEK